MAFKLMKDKPTLPELQAAAVQPKEEPKAEPKEVFEVVAKLPVKEVRRYQREDGVIVNLLTIEEALTAIANSE